MIVRLLKLAAILAAVLLALPAMAQPAAPGNQAAYTIRDVTVDRTAATANAAREAALLEAQRSALRRLLERLVPRSEHRRLPNPSDARIGDLVENFEVQNERTSPVRYIATLTYRFRPEEIRTLLRNANIPFAETYAKPYLVLPVLVQAGLAVLWDDPNPWRAAWGRRPPYDGLAPVTLPAGNLADISDINAEQARRGDNTRVAAISARYGTVGVIVAEAALDRSSGGRSVVQVSVSRYGGVSGEQTFVESYAAEPNEDDDALLTRAAAATARGIEERWKGEQLIRFGSEAKLTVLVSYEDVAEWAAIRRRLGEMTIVRRSDVVWITRHEALVDVSYVGDENQLRLALAQRDLDLSPRQSAGDVQWRLSITAPSAPAPRNAVGRPRR